MSQPRDVPGPTGLTSAEVAERMARGQVNRVRRSDAAEYLDIASRNLLTLFNALVVPAAIALFLLGDTPAGVAVSGMALTNTLLSLVQEVRAKRHLDRLTLLAEGRARVLRGGVVAEIPTGDVVEGDSVLLRAGDPIVADGPVLEARFLEVDEALLTGESDPVPRRRGDQLLSGSFAVAGEGAYRAEKVGAAAFAQRTAREARAYSYTASPLQHAINRLIRILTAVAVALSVGYLGLYSLRGDVEQAELVRWVAATITSMVPQGLVLMATLAFVLGAVRLSARGAIVGRLEAVEAMASIDVLCMDKTGTLTTNHLQLAGVHPLAGAAEEEVQRLLRLFVSLSVDRDSKSLAAIRQALGEDTGELLDQLPFKSQNRYSAVRVGAQGRDHALALGACEALAPFLGERDTWEPAWRELLRTGLRLVLLAEVVPPAPRDSFGTSLEGFALRPLALVALGDELRREAPAVLRALGEQGIGFKVLSGDNPETVRATIATLGHADSPALRALAEGPVVSGAELEAAADPDEVIRTGAVFGRVSPWQKVEIVHTLEAQGRRVAMLGDGVNDVLPIKNAHLGIAMGDGSRATKTVAGLVLQNNDFGLLPEALDEGRTIVRNLSRAGKLFLTKNAYTLLLIVGTLGVFGLPFPFVPQQVTLLNLLTIGIPALLIMLDRSRAGPAHEDFVRAVGAFALRTGLVTGLAALGLMLLSARAWGDEERMQRTLVLTVLVLLGWVTLWRALADGDTDGGSHLLGWLPLAGLPVYLAALYVPAAAAFFRLEPLDVVRWAWAVGTAAVGAGLMALNDRLARVWRRS
jgi:cation-transporting ATPase E